MSPDNIKCVDAFVTEARVLSNAQSPFECRYKLPASHFILLYTLVLLTAGSVAVENFRDFFNPSSLSLIALDAQEALFSSPLEQHFV